MRAERALRIRPKNLQRQHIQAHATPARVVARPGAYGGEMRADSLPVLTRARARGGIERVARRGERNARRHVPGFRRRRSRVSRRRQRRSRAFGRRQTRTRTRAGLSRATATTEARARRRATRISGRVRADDDGRAAQLERRRGAARNYGVARWATTASSRASRVCGGERGRWREDVA